MKLDELKRLLAQRKQSGFTMVELLIVIAIIALIAVAVLATLNPIEQINKARDTQKRTDAAELIKAAERFYAVHETYPWGFVNSGSWNSGDVVDSDSDFEGDPSEGWLDVLEDTSELKPSVITRLRELADDLYVAKSGSNDTVFVCFDPASDQFGLEAMERCNNDEPDVPGSEVTPCPSTPTIDDSWVCVP